MASPLGAPREMIAAAARCGNRVFGDQPSRRVRYLAPLSDSAYLSRLGYSYTAIHYMNKVGPESSEWMNNHQGKPTRDQSHQSHGTLSEKKRTAFVRANAIRCAEISRARLRWRRRKSEQK